MEDNDRQTDRQDNVKRAEVWEQISDQRSNNLNPEDDLSESFINPDMSECTAPYEVIKSDPILREIGDTPLIPHPENEQIAMKIERENPTLSHKDRLGAGMILGMRQKGELKKGQRVVEASSGNTAGGVALAANRLDHPCTIVMRETTSPVKMGFVRSLGAEVIEAPDASHHEHFYYQKVARRYAEEHDAVYLNQYENELNRIIHTEWTGPELLEQIYHTNVTHIVGAVSTCGIMTGIGKHIKSQASRIQIIGVDGEESNISRVFHNEELGDYDVDIEGLGQWRVTGVGDLDVLDDVRSVSDSIGVSRAKHEMIDNGVLMGLSSGAAMEVAQQITQENPDANVVSIIHDGPEQYFHELY